MEPDSSTANDENNNVIPENQNELATEISAEDEAALVDRVLGVKGAPAVVTEFGPDGKPVVAPEKDAATKAAEAAAADKDKDTQTDEEKAAAEKKAADDKAEADKVATEKAKADEEEENKPTEIAEVDSSDLWIEFEGVTVDEEGNQTAKTFKVGVSDELPEEARFKNDKQLAEYLEARKEMRDTLAERQAAHDKAVAEQETQTAEQASQQATLEGWSAEINDMIAAGLIDKPKSEPANGTTYTAEEIAADPGLTIQENVFKFMASENEKRKTEGKPVIPSFGTAFNLYNAQQSKKDADEKEKQEAEVAKKRGAMVGGASGASGGGGGSGKGDYVYKAGSAKSVHQVDTSDL